ncbi:hypothetical protein OED52_03750 [Rhodococcus sp. Z13]|uniref:Uncharacterized protein n=1 Tax=Rhodococcus sacchari TaxID=2962047 RepID=A0ACD4DI51_9NOCA|nr:hypothetical protein [Rhodococcus sp. Z13]UYP19687.1 hypothetical protein OED52_03750 [Rhodococcus sp. Z13]
MDIEIGTLEVLYEKISELSERETGTDAYRLGYRAALARARVFVLDERAGAMRQPA